MATDCIALPAPLGSTLQALRDARTARDAAHRRYQLARSIRDARRDQDAPEAVLVACEVSLEREAAAFVEATQVYLVLADRAVDDVESYLPANDASLESAAE
jgi:hypothetical protein